MNADNAIEIRNVSKSFKIPVVNSKYRATRKTEEHAVLNDISLDVKKGEVLGIVGRNGCGKSTLMNIIAHILPQDSGKISVRGKIASILELGMGFEPDQTGRENIKIKCHMYGMNNKEIDELLERMIQFSELGKQIDYPLRTYSSGMKAKLAFSVLIHVQCDTLIIDEILSVGDASFNAKCRLIFEKMKKEGKTVLLTSHNISTLEDMCDRVIWIENGTIKESGDAISVCYHYTQDLTESPYTLRALADEGDVTAQNRLGELYRDGIGVETNIAEAKNWFKQASDMGSVDAMVNLAEIEIQSGNIDEAAKLYAEAADLGNPIAISRLRTIGNEEQTKIIDILSQLKLVSDSGNYRAKKLLADIYSEGELVPKDYKTAFSLYKECADNGDPVSIYVLAMCYRSGIGTDRDGKKSAELLELSASRGYKKAIIQLINVYHRGIGIPRDEKKAIMWEEWLANGGDTKMMLDISNKYRAGIGIDKDDRKSDYWASRFSKQIRINIEFQLADILWKNNSENDKENAVEWYIRSAKEGQVMSMHTLASLYRTGQNVTKNLEQSFIWSSRASELNYSKATFDLAMDYLHGWGVEKDERKAFEILKKMSEEYDKRAMFIIANMYREGTVVTQNMVESKRLLSLLKEQGHSKAAELLKTMTG